MRLLQPFLQTLVHSSHFAAAAERTLRRAHAKPSLRLPFQEPALVASSYQQMYARSFLPNVQTREVRNLATSTKSYGKGTYLDREQVTERVLALVKAVHKVDPAKVHAKARFNRDLGLDSLATVELLMAIEEEFGVQIPNKDADKIVCSADAIDFIASHPQRKECA